MSAPGRENRLAAALSQPEQTLSTRGEKDQDEGFPECRCVKAKGLRRDLWRQTRSVISSTVPRGGILCGWRFRAIYSWLRDADGDLGPDCTRPCVARSWQRLKTETITVRGPWDCGKRSLQLHCSYEELELGDMATIGVAMSGLWEFKTAMVETVWGGTFDLVIDIISVVLDYGR